MSEQKATARSIQCRNCGSPLSVRGGHKVKSLTCEHCGAIMNPQENFRLVQQFSEQQGLYMNPLTLGATGKLKGVQFTVVGVIAWESWGDVWIDYQLYSPTHGYAWLTYSKAHWMFTRRVRDLPNGRMWSLDTKDKIKMRGKDLRFYEKYNAKVIYVAGELTWVARVGDATTMADAIAPPYMLTAEKSEQENEYYWGEYIDEQVVTDEFGYQKSYAMVGVHPAQPYNHPRLQAVSKASWPFALFALFALIVISLLFSGKLLQQHTIQPQDLSDGSISIPMTINNADRLVKATFKSAHSNVWARYAMSIIDTKTNQAVHTFGKELSFYEGYDDGYWSEGNQTMTAHFRVPEAGTYYLRLEATDFEKAPPTLYIKIYEGYVSPFYFIVLLAFSAIAFLINILMRWWFESRRWAPVMEEDD